MLNRTNRKCKQINHNFLNIIFLNFKDIKTLI